MSAGSRTGLRIGGFVAALGLLFAGAFGVGRWFEDDPRPEDGYSLRLVSQQAEPSPQVDLSFAVLDPDEDVVTDFAVKHTKRLHLIAVAKDFSGYRHLHPTMTPSGQWTVSTDLSGGAWRLYADFRPAGGSDEVATADLQVAGAAHVDPPAAPSRNVRVDGFRVQLTGDLVAGHTSQLALRVTRGGRWVAPDLYLGAQGHLVVIRQADYSYLHAHPEELALGAPQPPVLFDVVTRAAGRHHLYFDFKVGSQVHTAHFVVDAAGLGAHVYDTEEMDHGDH